MKFLRSSFYHSLKIGRPHNLAVALALPTTLVTALILSSACTRNTDPVFSNSISTQANLNALGPALKELQPHWDAEQRQGTSWSMVEMSFENSVVPFQRSSQRLALDLLLNSNESLDALKFARGISPEYKNKAVAILEMATQVGMETWGHDFFDSILQTRPSLARLAGYQKTLEAGLVFTAQEERRSGFTNRNGIHDSISERQEEARVELLNRAIDEKWEVEQFEDLEVILGIARLEHPCGKLPTRSLMVRCLGSSHFSRQEGLGFFAPSYGRRYQELAKESISNLIENQTSEANHSTAMADAFFSSNSLLWSHCESDQFSIKRALLRGSFHALRHETDDIRRLVMERQIHDVLRDCTVSPVASPTPVPALANRPLPAAPDDPSPANSLPSSNVHVARTRLPVAPGAPGTASLIR